MPRSFRRKALRLTFSFRRFERFSCAGVGGSRLPLALSLAIAANGAAVCALVAQPSTSPVRVSNPSDADTPRLLRLVRSLKAAPLAQAQPALPLNLDPLPLPPPPPPLEALPPEPVVEASDGWNPREPVAVLSSALAWIPPAREGFDPSDPFLQGIRRRQRWLKLRQADQLQALWDGASERRSSGGLEWRALNRSVLEQLDLPPTAPVQLHGLSLVQGQQLTLIWWEQGRWWLIRAAVTG